MRKLAVLAVVILLGLALIRTVHRSEADARSVAIRVNGRTLPLRGEIRYDRVYADAIPLSEALGLRAVFFPDKPERGVTLQSTRKFIHLHTNQNDCHVDGRTVQLGAPALYIDLRTKRPMAPVRFIAETYGGTVEERLTSKEALIIINIK